MEKDQNSLLISNLDQVKVKLIDYQAGEEGRWTQEKKVFLEFKEFFNLLCSHYVIMFEDNFEGVIQWFKEAGYPPEGVSPDFLDLSKALDILPEEKFGSE